jgi:Tfp pilus assembly protein PilF
MAMNPALAQVPAKLHQARTLHEQGELARARFLYEKVLKIQPRNVEALNWLGVISAQTGNANRGVYLFGRATEIDPDNAGIHCNMGLALHELGQLADALRSHDRAIALRTDYAEAYFNRGNVLRDLYQLEAALASYDQAIALNADYADAYSNRGIVLYELRHLDAALASYERALAIRPDYAKAHFNKASTLLLRGDLHGGWPHYEWRWKLGGASLTRGRQFQQPRWLGKESLAGKTILLYGEQGFGDTLQFCRYAKSVADLGARVILEVQKPLMPLLADLDGPSQLIATGSALPPLDYHCPLMSLPLAFNTCLDTIPASVPYLLADPIKVARWRERLGETKAPRIGLVWSGSATNLNDHNRSIRLADWVPYLPAQCQFVSLQKDVREADAATLESTPTVLNFADELNDFSDTAALCECMDLVISVCTSVAHLSGALGKDTWVMLGFAADWRWLLDRADSPWYPSMKLYRPRNRGDWQGVFGQVESDLRRIIERSPTFA